jgi:hypothetical protein
MMALPAAGSKTTFTATGEGQTPGTIPEEIHARYL